MTKPKLTIDEMKERIKGMEPFTFQHGATIEVRSIVEKNGILVTLKNPNPSQMADDSIAIIIPPDEANGLSAWLRVYLAKVKGLKNGKKETGSGD